MAYNHGKAEYKWKLWKEREEKILRDSGVTEDTIEAIRFYDRQAFNSDRRYYERVQETDTYLDTVAASTDQAEPKTVQDFLDYIENQELFHVLITVDRLKEKVQNDVWIAVFMQLFLVALDKSLDFRRIRLLSAVSQGKNKRNKILVAGAAHQHHMQAALHPKENAALRVCCQVKPLGHLIQIILLGFTHVENSPYLSVFQPPDAGGRPVHISRPR